jgi:hypothetical protein
MHGNELLFRLDGPNKGRSFYRCGNNDNCNFFAWKDEYVHVIFSSHNVKYNFILVQRRVTVEVVKDKMEIINRLLLVNGEIQIMMRKVNNVNVVSVKRQVIRVEIVHL